MYLGRTLSGDYQIGRLRKEWDPEHGFCNIIEEPVFTYKTNKNKRELVKTDEIRLRHESTYIFDFQDIVFNLWISKRKLGLGEVIKIKGLRIDE